MIYQCFFKKNIFYQTFTFIYKYEQPNYHITCADYYKYCEQGILMKLNEPLYFYHVVNKSADLSVGLLSLKYMYDHNMFSLFDKYTDKYRNRIVNDWHIDKYSNRDSLSLTREEILDGLELFRGVYGPSYIYFFKYPLTKKLGSKIEKLLIEKDIYRININDEEIQRKIKDIFYGYWNSNSDNELLNKKYYEKVTKKEYFSQYNDNLEMNFSTLNHIAIAFNDDYCPITFLEKIT